MSEDEPRDENGKATDENKERIDSRHLLSYRTKPVITGSTSPTPFDYLIAKIEHLQVQIDALYMMIKVIQEDLEEQKQNKNNADEKVETERKGNEQ